jgi:hypothetical protein
MTNTADELGVMLQEASKEITFDSTVLKEAPSMSKTQLQIEIDHRIDVISDPDTNIEIKERMEKEARVLAIRKLRQEA